jgi:hypothetical protein
VVVVDRSQLELVEPRRILRSPLRKYILVYAIRSQTLEVSRNLNSGKFRKMACIDGTFSKRRNGDLPFNMPEDDRRLHVPEPAGISPNPGSNRID